MVTQRSSSSLGQPGEYEIKVKMLDLSINSITLSFIHRKSELMTVYMSKLNSHIVDTEDSKTIKFSIGYLQLDNQSETDPVYPVLLKPKILEYSKQD